MSENTKEIHSFDYQLITNFFKRLHRQGPGSEEVTKKALNFVGSLSDGLQVADIGCGTGAQTITLADNIMGHITAIDLSSDFIAVLNRRIGELGYQDKISTLVVSMDNLPFSENQVDLIWSEGAIYNIGFENGLRQWWKYLKPEGYIAVSEVSWFTLNRPSEIQEFWDLNYPQIDIISNKVAQMEEAGYVPVAHFILPEYCWLDNFFGAMPQAMESFLEEQNNSEAAKLFVEYEKQEMALYKRYKEYYGYVFYIGKKLG